MTSALTRWAFAKVFVVLVLSSLATVWGLRPAGAGLTTIDFDSLSHGDIITGQFSGVEFSLLGPAPTAGPIAYALKDGAIANTGNAVNVFGASGLGITTGTVTSTILPPFFDLQVAFAEPTDFFSIMVLDAEETFSVKGFFGSSLIQEVTRSSATLIGNRSSSPFAGPVFEVSLGAVSGGMSFDRVVIDLNKADGPEVYDNLIFNTVNVPEPPTVALFVVGLAGLGFMWGRRKY